MAGSAYRLARTGSILTLVLAASMMLVASAYAEQGDKQRRMLRKAVKKVRAAGIMDVKMRETTCPAITGASDCTVRAWLEQRDYAGGFLASHDTTDSDPLAMHIASNIIVNDDIIYIQATDGDGCYSGSEPDSTALSGQRTVQNGKLVYWSHDEASAGDHYGGRLRHGVRTIKWHGPVSTNRTKTRGTFRINRSGRLISQRIVVNYEDGRVLKQTATFKYPSAITHEAPGSVCLA